MVAIKPPLKRSFGNNRYFWVPAIADIQNPTLTELQAAEAFNLSCTTFRDQEQPTASTTKVTLPALNCETETYQVNGETEHSAPDLRVSFDPQADDGEDGVKAWEAMDDNAEGFLVRSQGVTATADLAAGQRVDIWPGQLGVKVPGQTSNDAAGVYAFTVGFSITGQPAFRKEIVAGA